MHRFWEPILEPLLDRADPKVIVEIGSDHGFNTRNLLAFSVRRGATLHVIDPFPKYEVEEWLAEYPNNLVFHRAPSLAVIGSIQGAEVVLIDGDHNWHTVFHELKRLEETVAGDPDRFPLVLLHDVGWPYARRDLYYEPDRIPSPDRHRYGLGGLRPGREDLDPTGGLNGHLFNALHEGGPRNGVLTGVEDFVEEASFEVAFVDVPGINDLGILYATSLRQRKPLVTDFIEDLTKSSELRHLLRQVETLRIEAQIEWTDSQQDVKQLRSAVTKLEKDLAEVGLKREESVAEVARLIAEIDKHRDTTREYQETKALLETAQATMASVRRELEASGRKAADAERQFKRLRSRRSVRAALLLAKFTSPLFRPVRSLKPVADNPPVGLGARRKRGRRDQTRLAKLIVRERPGSPVSGGPLVSIVVLTRNGAEHLKRLLRSLDQGTRYRSFEVIVVDNGSTDETADVLDLHRSFPLKVVANERNTSFSEGNNQGVAIAEGEFLLFLNNDIEPINPGWLGAMVDAIQGDDANVAAGAELVYPVRGRPSSDLTVQHTGIQFNFTDHAARAVNVGAPDPLDDGLAGVVAVPAATAAAFMVRAEAFRRVGGFDEGYVYGTEDVDLCLKLGELGNIVVTGQAVLFHHESATQTQVASEVTIINRLGNRLRFAEHWGPQVTRSVRRDRFSRAGYWASQRPNTVAITLTHDDISKGWGDYYTAHELGDAFAAAGWDVRYLERYQDRWYDADGDVDLLISLLDSFDVRRGPGGAFTIAWVRNWLDRWLEQPWFEAYDLVTTSSHNAARHISNRSRFVPVLIPMATNPERFRPGPPNPTFESSYTFTGNNWGPGRGIVQLLDVEPDERFLLFGKGWNKDPRIARYWRGHLGYELLPEVYRSTKIVLDDTAGPTRPYAFVNGRVFDALASGALVLSDNVEGSQEMFDGLLPTYSDRQDLRAQLDHYLSNEGDRVELVDRLREQVLARHSYAARPEEFSRLAKNHIERPHAAIKIAVPNDQVRSSWGDTHFAGALAHALTALGLLTEVHILPEWDLPSKQSVDVVIHLRGLANYTPKPAHINVLWIISHPDDVSERECEKYDLILVASRSHADFLRARIERPVVFMPQATDQRRFHPVDPSRELETEVLFLGNSRGQKRPAVDWAIGEGLPLTVYGGGWRDRIPSRFVRADHFPNENLATLYASAKVVLNDHWPDMRDKGFVSNRVFDALGSGAVVVSDRATGLEEMFGDLVPTYDDPVELSQTVRTLLEDEGRREKISHEASVLIAEEHTFSRRAEQLVGLIRPLIAGRRRDVEGSRFQDQRWNDE